MKKRIFSLFVILSLIGGMAYAYDADGNPNTKRETASTGANVPYREYQLVRWAENSASPTGGNLSAGDVVVGDCVSDDGVTIAIVSATNSTDAVRGVVVSATIPTADAVNNTITSDVGRRNWGYIQVRGYCAKVNVFAGGAAGSTLVAAQQVRCATVPGPTNVQTRTLGFAYDASEAGNSNDVDIEI